MSTIGTAPAVGARHHGPDPSGGGGHLAAVDVVRLVTILGVLLVHATSLTVPYGSVAGGAVLDVAHVTRSVFLLLSAFVLTYSARRRPLGTRAFWRRRYPLVVLPYALWSLVYVLTDGDTHLGVTHTLATYGRDLLDGDAHFHLYFLLLTMQLYLVFPALLAGLRRWPKAVPAVLGVAVVAQLVYVAAVHYGPWPPLLGSWVDRGNNWLPAYAAEVLGGLAAGWYLDEVVGWVRRHARLVVLAWVGSVALALAGYLADLTVLHDSPYKASEVFQPTVVLEAITAAAAQLSLGLWLVGRLPARGLRLLEQASDVSFGVYLAHPLLLGVLIDLSVASGLSASLVHLPTGLAEAGVAVVLVPVTYLATALAVQLVRRTRFSLALTGRRRRPRLRTAERAAP